MTEANGELITTLNFTGGQFDMTGFPAARAEELSHYRDLFIAAAKTVWRRRNPGRRNLPPGFEDSIQLSFVISEGSTVAECISHGIPYEQIELESIATLTQERIDQIFRGIVSDQNLTDVEDDEIKPLKRIGSTFAADEALTLRRAASTPITYDVTSRNQLLAALGANSVHATVIGRVVALDVNLGFAVKPVDNAKKITGRFTDENLFPEFHAVLSVNSDATSLMWLDCEMELSAKTGKPRTITDVYAVGTFPPVHPHDAADIALLAQHEDGWFDGEGTRISPDTLESAVDLINRLRAAGISGPVIGGDPDGAVTLHWIDDPVAVIVTTEPGNTFSAVRTNANTHEHEHRPRIVGAEAASLATQELLTR